MRQAMPYAVLGLGIIVMGGIAWWFGSKLETVPEPRGDAIAPEVSEGDSIYASGVYGFLVTYPGQARVEEGYDGPWRMSALPDSEGTPILSITTFEVTSDTYYPRTFQALVRLGVSTDPREVRECLSPRVSQGEQELPDTVIGGHTFKAFSFGDAAMMQYVKGISYRTVFEERCYAIERIARGSSYREGAASDQDVPDAALDEEYQRLDAIIQSFRFAR